MAKVIEFPTIKDYGDFWIAVMHVCMEVQFDGLDHIDATAKICDLVEMYKRIK